MTFEELIVIVEQQGKEIANMQAVVQKLDSAEFRASELMLMAAKDQQNNVARFDKLETNMKVVDSLILSNPGMFPAKVHHEVAEIEQIVGLDDQGDSK